MAKRDYYEILGLSKTASRQEIKTAYRKLAKQYHPDRNKAGDAEAKFKEVQEAYEVLSDDQKRTAYDKYGHAATQGFGGFGASRGGYSDIGFDFGDFGSINDIFEQFFGGGFGGFSTSGPTTNARQARGRDLEVTLNLTFNEAVFGAEKIIRYQRNALCQICHGIGASGNGRKTCPTCKGQGRVRQVQQTFIGNFQTVTTCPTCQGKGEIITEYCKNCGGKGTVDRTEDFKIKIPHGIPDGVTLRFSEKGDAGRNGGGVGDLFVNIEVQNHPNLERRGNDIYLDMELDITDAVLGGQFTVPTVNGTDSLKIPSGSQYGDVIKMSGKGGPKFKGKGYGDQYIRLVVKVPKKLTKEQKRIWQELHTLKNEHPGFFESMFN